MKILKQESETSRIVQKRTVESVFGLVICRQRKDGWFWKTTTWLYTHQCNTLDEYIDHFNAVEDPKELVIGKARQF